MRTPLAALAALVVPGMLFLASGAAAEDAYKQDLARYKAWQERPSLFMRHKGRVEFAQTGDVRALKVLAKSYAKPEVPKDQVQYLLASLCADHFKAPPHVATLRAWRRKHAKPQDAWLWRRVLGTELAIDGPPELVDVVRRHASGVLRAAALEALLEAKDPAALALATDVLGSLPARPLDRAALLGTCAEALRRTAAQRHGAAWKAAAELLLHAYEETSTLEGTRLVLARRLQIATGAPRLHASAEAWRAVIHGKPLPTPAQGKGTRYAAPKKPTFLGVEAAGRRIVYVIDMSDSMLTPLTGKEIDDLKQTPARAPPPRPVVTGGPKATHKAPPPAKPGPDPEVAKLPWARIRTRFDAAREFLKLSLRTLTPGQSFCVIGFGTDARALAATPGLMPATPGNVAKASVALDVIEPGPRTKARPYGTLRGRTNLHGGLHRAFKLRGKTFVRRHEYVDLATFQDGCDTIFLLSDGKPTWDDWPEWDIRLPEHKSGDPESGAEVQDHEKGHYYGPYARASVIWDDLRRLNLLRKVEIHCVGLGEYDPRLLESISANGLGRFRRVGAR